MEKSENVKKCYLIEGSEMDSMAPSGEYDAHKRSIKLSNIVKRPGVIISAFKNRAVVNELNRLDLGFKAEVNPINIRARFCDEIIAIADSDRKKLREFSEDGILPLDINLQAFVFTFEQV